MNFSYKAIDCDGNVVKGKYECTCEDELMKNLREHGYYLMSYIPCKRGIFKDMFIHPDILAISLICSQMSVALEAGVTLPEAIMACRNSCRKRTYRKSLDDIYHSVINGESIGSFLGKNNRLYPFLMVQMLKIGESSGTLNETLKQLSFYYEKEYEIRNKIISSLTYPIIVFLSTVVVLMVLMSSVVPQFADTLSEMNMEVPEATLHLMRVCGFIRTYAFYIFLGALFTALFIKYGKKFYKVRQEIDKHMLHMPYAGKIIKSLDEARFINVMHMMITCGYDFLEAMRGGSYVIVNNIIKGKIEDCILKITNGEDISDSLYDTAILSPVFISFLRAGEKSGEMEECISKARDVINGSLNENIKRIVTCIEPFSIAVLAFVVCMVIFSLIMPLMGIMDSIYAGI